MTKRKRLRPEAFALLLDLCGMRRLPRLVEREQRARRGKGSVSHSGDGVHSGNGIGISAPGSEHDALRRGACRAGRRLAAAAHARPAGRRGAGAAASAGALSAMGGARVVSGDAHARRRWPGRDAGMRGAARAVSTMWSGPEGRGVARDGDERPPRARPFEHRAQGPMGCVRVGSLARRGERAAAAGRRLGSSSARTAADRGVTAA